MRILSKYENRMAILKILLTAWTTLYENIMRKLNFLIALLMQEPREKIIILTQILLAPIFCNLVVPISWNFIGW